jgi:hypothetical protein
LISIRVRRISQQLPTYAETQVPSSFLHPPCAKCRAFTDVTEKAGLHYAGWAAGVCVGDYNNDGFEDLFCSYFGQNKLYRNNGDGTFTDVTKEAGLLNESPRWGGGCTFVDYNRDGHLDLFV